MLAVNVPLTETSVYHSSSTLMSVKCSCRLIQITNVK